MEDINSGTMESTAEIKTDQDVVKRWLNELAIADKEESGWRENARRAIRRYRDEDEAHQPMARKQSSRFNILWANTEILRPALYNSTPTPDVRRRYRDPDPIGREVAEVLERATAYLVDSYDFDHTMNQAILDYVLPGRAVVRVRYKPVFEEATDVFGETYEEKRYETVVCESVPWQRFRRGPGASWDDVSWIAYEHHMTRDELTEEFGEQIGHEVELDIEYDVDKGKEARKDDVFGRGRVWEIWDKDERKVVFMAPSRKTGPLRVDDDPLGLEGFFDCPRPLYAVDSPDSLVPIEEYRLYRDQAQELDRVTQRIQRVMDAMRVRGVYDATIKELSTVMRGDDNDLVPSDGARGILAQSGGLDRHIWLMPIQQFAATLASLYTQRDQIKQTIYEVVGLSDIIRGATNPHETLGAQQIKMQSAGNRLTRRKQEVQRFCRDLFRIKVEIMSELFAPETLQVMTGRPVTPEMIQVMSQDGSRGFRIDIETDSTVAVDLATDQQQITELITGIAQYAAAIGPVVQSGYLPADAAKSILLASIRRFNLGRQGETALEAMEEPQEAQMMGQQAQMPGQQQQQPQQPDVGQVMEQRAKMQLETQKNQINAQFKGAEINLKQREQALKEAEAQHKAQMDIADRQLKAQDIGGKMQMHMGDRADRIASSEMGGVGAQNLTEMANAIATLSEQVQFLIESMQGPRTLQ